MSLRVVEIDDREFRARARKGMRNASADAAGRAGDHRDLALETPAAGLRTRSGAHRARPCRARKASMRGEARGLREKRGMPAVRDAERLEMRLLAGHALDGRGAQNVGERAADHEHRNTARSARTAARDPPGAPAGVLKALPMAGSMSGTGLPSGSSR